MSVRISRSMKASASDGVITFRSSVGMIAPVIWPLLSTATDFRMSNSNRSPSISPMETTNGLARLMVTWDVVRLSCGLELALVSSVLIVG